MYSCQLKKDNLKVESYVFSGGHDGDLSQGGSLSASSEGLLQRGQGGARLCQSFYKKTIPTVAQWATNLTSINKDVDWIPGLAQWVKDPVLW